jgi:hypothetical protein
MVFNYIPLEYAIADLTNTLSSEYWSETDVMELAFRALRSINVIESYTLATEAIPVTNYKGCLPDDLRVIALMAYKLDSSLTDAEILEKIIADIGLDNDYYYQGFDGNNWTPSEYAPLRATASPWANSVHCDNCINLTIVSEHTYRLNPNNTFTTSFKEGTVCLAYYSLPKDNEGNYLIPDNEVFINAVRSYIMMRHWEYRMNMKEEGSINLYMHYLSMWELNQQKARGEAKKPSLDQLENIRQSRNRLIPKERNYYRGFNNRPEEDLNF